jgi:transposase InsO family protein
MEQRIEFLLRAARGEEHLGELCSAFGVHRSTGHRWLKRFQEVGSVLELKEGSRRPHTIPRQTEHAIEEQVLALREQYGWGARKIQVLLERTGIRLGPATVHRILQRGGTVRKPDPSRSQGKRFERKLPNELWQMDFKGIKEIWAKRYGPVCPWSALDDHSRYLTGMAGLSSTGAVETLSSFRRASEECGLPEAMLIDHGVPWWNHANGYGLTQFSVELMKQGIRLYFGRPSHPQTQGKIERMHRSLEEALRQADGRKRFPGWGVFLQTFREEYNNVRPHEALGMQVPASRYRPSRRYWNPNPPAWDYGSGIGVAALNSQGSLLFEGKRYFVCHALAREEVAVEVLGNRLLVQYRRTWLREIDLSTGRSMPILSGKRFSQI